MVDADMIVNHNPIFKQLPSEEDFQTEMTNYRNKNLEDLPILGTLGSPFSWRVPAR